MLRQQTRFLLSHARANVVGATAKLRATTVKPNFTQSALSLTGADAAIPRLTMTPDERVLSYEDARAILRVRAHALCCGCCRLASESLFDDESVNFIAMTGYFRDANS